MALTLVLGPANASKAGEVFGAYTAAAERGAVLVVPNAGDAEHYQRELTERGAVLGSVLTFTGLVGEIARRAGYGPRRLSPIQRERAVLAAARRAPLDALAPAARTTGFATAAGEFIAELERSLIAPERFARAMRTWGSEDPRRAAYAREIASIYLAYAGELRRLEAVDGELFAWRALDALRAAPGRWGTDPVFFYGFDDLHSLQRDAVETLARVVGTEVMVSLTYEPGRAAVMARAELVEELRPMADQVLELPALDDYYAPESRAVLHHLERSLFEPGGDRERLDPGQAVRLLEAAGERSEVELVASEVSKLLRAGIPGEEIAVVYRSVPPATAMIARTFAQSGIDVDLQTRVAFGHTALGRGLIALARCALLPKQASAHDLLGYLRTPGVLRRPEIADALELKVRRQGLTRAAEAHAQLGFALEEIEALARADDQPAELARNARRLLAAPRRGEASVLDSTEELDARALAALVRAFRELEEMPGQRLSGRELIELVEGIEVSAAATGNPGSVLVTDSPAIRARRFRAVIVCGLQEGAFPRAPSPDPFLSDEQRWELAACSGLRLAQRGDALERERYLFYSALSRATEQVVLSYRSSDEDGNLELPSPFIADVAELLAADWPQRRRRRLLGQLVWEPEEAPSARELARARAVAAAAASGEAGGQGRRLSQAALDQIRHTRLVSAGALETYADCPVKWLVERELRPQRFGPDPDPIARGSYMHDVLERLLERLAGPVTPASLPAALQILEDVMAQCPPRIAPGRPERLREAAAETIAADLRRYLEHEAASSSGWEPERLELRFGFDEDASLPALELGEGADRVAVRGAIDRVDVEPGGRRAVVRDYKSGGSRLEHQGGRWSEQRRLQVALYMLAVRDLLGIEPIAGLYQPLGGRDLRARGIFLEGEPVGAELVATDARDRDGLDAELSDAAGRAVSLAARLRTGDLTPCPGTCSRDGCRYPGICRAT